MSDELQRQVWFNENYHLCAFLAQVITFASQHHQRQIRLQLTNESICLDIKQGEFKLPTKT